MKSVSLLGVPITISSCEEILFEVKQAVEKGESRFIVTPNPEIIVEAQRNKQFLKVLQNADIALPDGTGVVFALRVKNICVQRLPGRVCFLHLLDLADRYA
ncbi:MAG: hypothetical protein N3A54_06955, partial [Patescibacteria group bacterium]|nr:hypothetical protein [Patescibacteria group bacterium]